MSEFEIGDESYYAEEEVNPDFDKHVNVKFLQKVYGLSEQEAEKEVDEGMRSVDYSAEFSGFSNFSDYVKWVKDDGYDLTEQDKKDLEDLKSQDLYHETYIDPSECSHDDIDEFESSTEDNFSGQCKICGKTITQSDFYGETNTTYDQNKELDSPNSLNSIGAEPIDAKTGVGFLDIANGSEKLNKDVASEGGACSSCWGSGTYENDDGETEKCSDCNGTGLEDQWEVFGDESKAQCQDCGRSLNGKKECEKCEEDYRERQEAEGQWGYEKLNKDGTGTAIARRGLDPNNKKHVVMKFDYVSQSGCDICAYYDEMTFARDSPNRPIIPRLESQGDKGTRPWTHPNCKCRWTKVFTEVNAKEGMNEDDINRARDFYGAGFDELNHAEQTMVGISMLKKDLGIEKEANEFDLIDPVPFASMAQIAFNALKDPIKQKLGLEYAGQPMAEKHDYGIQNMLDKFAGSSLGKVDKINIESELKETEFTLENILDLVASKLASKLGKKLGIESRSQEHDVWDEETNILVEPKFVIGDDDYKEEKGEGMFDPDGGDDELLFGNPEEDDKTEESFNEEDHPRDDDGKFGSGSGSSEKDPDRYKDNTDIQFWTGYVKDSVDEIKDLKAEIEEMGNSFISTKYNTKPDLERKIKQEEKELSKKEVTLSRKMDALDYLKSDEWNDAYKVWDFKGDKSVTDTVMPRYEDLENKGWNVDSFDLEEWSNDMNEEIRHAKKYWGKYAEKYVDLKFKSMMGNDNQVRYAKKHLPEIAQARDDWKKHTQQAFNTKEYLDRLKAEGFTSKRATTESLEDNSCPFCGNIGGEDQHDHEVFVHTCHYCGDFVQDLSEHEKTHEVTEAVNKCPECGNVSPEGTEKCPQCGYNGEPEHIITEVSTNYLECEVCGEQFWYDKPEEQGYTRQALDKHKIIHHNDFDDTIEQYKSFEGGRGSGKKGHQKWFLGTEIDITCEHCMIATNKNDDGTCSLCGN